MFCSILDGPPYDLEIEDAAEEPGLMIAVPLAKDATRVVLVQTLLLDAEIDGFAHAEVVFQIAVVSIDGSQEDFVTQMRDTARQYLPEECIPK